MKVDRVIRFVIAGLILVLFIAAVGGVLFVTESALNIWEKLSNGPRLFLYLYAAIMLSLAAWAGWLVWRLVVRREVKNRPAGPVAEALSRTEIEHRLQEAEAAGVDTETAQRELQELAARQKLGAVHLCFFGEISTGKSSLLKSLVPDADVRINAVGGSTDDIRHYRWVNDAGVEILLTDVPGTGGHEAGLDQAALEEARRSHVVLFVSDGDLTRAEAGAMEQLLALQKPVVAVLNKSDRYSPDEQALLMQRLLEHMETLGGEVESERVVAVSAGGEVDVIERDTKGRETAVRRQRPADIGVLVVAINSLLTDQSESLDVRRERAVFRLAAEKLREAETEYRIQRSEQIIRNATRKAVVGSLAAVSPGTDILIQGYVGTSMTQQLCELYGAVPRDLDIEEFLSLSQSRVGRALPLTLAVAGNGLKAFPGLGTVAGGFVHAVAYGLIFDALGRSLVLTLSKHGELKPAAAARDFEENINEHLEAGVKRVAAMALEEAPKK